MNHKRYCTVREYDGTVGVDIDKNVVHRVLAWIPTEGRGLTNGDEIGCVLGGLRGRD